MMDSMMANMQAMMFGMGAFGLLVLVALVLVIAAAVKYLLFDKREKER